MTIIQTHILTNIPFHNTLKLLNTKQNCIYTQDLVNPFQHLQLLYVLPYAAIHVLFHILKLPQTVLQNLNLILNDIADIFSYPNYQFFAPLFQIRIHFVYINNNIQTLLNLFILLLKHLPLVLKDLFKSFVCNQKYILQFCKNIFNQYVVQMQTS